MRPGGLAAISPAKFADMPLCFTRGCVLAGKAAGKAGKFLGRVGMKIARNIKGGEVDVSSLKNMRETQSYTQHTRSRRSIEVPEVSVTS